MEKVMGISSNTAKLHLVFGKKLYSSKYAWISEVCQNAVDSHRMAGVKEPVKIGVKYDLANRNKTIFFVEDIGLSFKDEEDFVSKVCVILESGKTADKSNDENCAMGMHGIGSIAVSAYQNNWKYTVVTPTGEKFIAILKEVEGKGITYDIQHLGKTTESKKVLFEVDVQFGDFRNLVDNMKVKLAYFKDIMFEFPADMIRDNRQLLTLNSDFQILRSDDFQISTFSREPYLHVSLDQYTYPIDWNFLGISPIGLNIGLKFGMGDKLEADLTRENLQKDEHYKKVIMGKIRKVADWMVQRYNGSFPDEVTSISEMTKLVRANPSITLGDKSYYISDISKYSATKVKKPEFKGVSRSVFDKFVNNSAMFVKQKYAINSSGSKVKKDLYGINSSHKPLFMDAPISIRMWDYLKSEYKGSTIHEKVKCPAFKKKNGYWNSYEEMYGLNKTIMKQKYHNDGVNYWRDTIDQVQILENQYIKEYTSPISKITIPADFNRVPPKKRATVEKFDATTLAGDISLKRGARSYHGYYTTKFETVKSKVKDVVTSKTQYIWGEEEDRTKLDTISKMFNWASKPIDMATCIAGVTAKKIIEQLKPSNFMHVSDFMKGKHEIFRQMVTAYHVDKELRQPNHGLFMNRRVINKYINVEIHNDLDEMEKYVLKFAPSNFLHMDPNEIKPILDVAKELDLYDKPVWDKLQAMKVLIPNLDYILLVADHMRYKDKESRLKMVRILHDCSNQRGIAIDKDNLDKDIMKIKVSKDDY